MNLTAGVEAVIELDQLPVGSYVANITSNVPNYDVAFDETTFNVLNGTIDVNVTIDPVNYPDNAVVIVNASVDGNYTVNVDGNNYTVEVVNGTGNVTVDVLPVGEYPVDVTAVIPNYNPVSEPATLIVNNGTINVTIKVDDVT